MEKAGRLIVIKYVHASSLQVVFILEGLQKITETLNPLFSD